MQSIRVEGLAKSFGDRVAVEGLTFDVQPGEVFGLLGPNGAGKTTTVRMLVGLLEPSKGRAEINGVSVVEAPEKVRSWVGLLTEQPGLYDRLSAKENLEFFMRIHEVNSKEAWTRTFHYLKLFGLAGRENDPVGTFSKGMRQKLALVRTLVHGPSVLFLDEPTSGLDPEAARIVRDAVAQLAQEGQTIILCSHNLTEVERLCSRVAIIKTQLRALAPVKELRREGLSLEIELENNSFDLQAAIGRLPFAPNVLSEGNKLRVMLQEEKQAPDVVAALVHAHARIFSVTRRERPLEEVYLELVRQKELEVSL